MQTDPNIIGRAILGVTGSRYGWKPQQEAQTKKLFLAWDFIEMHHGDCIGVDAQFHTVCSELKIPIVIHPPEKDELRAFCLGARTILPPKNYFARNRDIVDSSQLIAAVPSHMNREKGGTWYTAKYAHSKEKNLIIFLPTGAIEVYGVQNNSRYGRLHPETKNVSWE